MGKAFRAYRNHPHHLRLFGKPLNQELLGRWLGLTQAQVSKAEKGKPELNLEVLRRYALVLQIPKDLLWFDFPGEKRRTSATTLGSATMDSATTIAATLELPQKVVPWSPSNLLNEDPTTHVERLISAREHFEQMYRSSGGLTTGNRIDMYLARQTLPLLTGMAGDGNMGLKSQRAMGGLVALAGVCAYDSEDWSVAYSRFSHALLIAEAARDYGFHAYVLALMVNQALALEDYKSALQLAEVGLRSSEKVPPSPLLIDLQTMKAKALAFMGDRSEAMAMIREIENTAGRLAGSHDIAEASYAQEGHLHAQLAEALASLREFHAAGHYAEQALVSDGHPRGKVNRLASMATLEMAMGDIERASSLACQMVDTARGMDSRRLSSRFAKLRAEFASQPTTTSREAIARIDSAIAVIL
ncbi:helix-turn-helix domain-containing protein [Actinokineospora globicatena]|uniref:helix-turn-helix domain-containing protein n=1 Tax=Actinokineospora globicatena TaxID=103729 RepID=UPI0020A4A5C5|nr:helix-turn-helix transcriptional regulator [Actinokineospora globicatena]